MLIKLQAPLSLTSQVYGLVFKEGEHTPKNCDVSHQTKEKTELM